MKFTYFSRSFNNIYSGVEKKIASQVFSLKQLGIDASILSLTDIHSAQIRSGDIHYIMMPVFSKSRIGFIRILKQEHFIILSLWQIICKMGSDDILYMRFNYPFFTWWYYLQKNRKCKVVFEHQDLESREYMMRGNYLYRVFDYIFGGSIRGHCDGIVGVTDEITLYEVKRSGDQKKPHVTIGNGINVDTVPMKNAFPFHGSPVHLLCVSNVSKWHGLDRLIRGMSTFSDRRKIHLHIVGSGEELPVIKKMVNDLSLNDAVFFYGPLHGKELDELFNRCDIGVGTLGIHRKGLHEASTLKAREYCARGMPFIEGTSDLDFPPDFPYILHIPADESPVDIPAVIRFTELIYADLSFPVKMREYARNSLDWSIKAVKLKGFLESLV